MKNLIFLFLIAAISAGCTSQKLASSSAKGANQVAEKGSSFENAVVIHEKSETSGVKAEYKWIRKNYPGASMLGQSLVFHNKKPYDILKIKYKGMVKKVYFDISKFYGKF